jgi:hypothetical protein
MCLSWPVWRWLQVVTFDYFGVSAHPNHVALHTGVRWVAVFGLEGCSSL